MESQTSDRLTVVPSTINSYFSFFQLPYPMQVKIISYLPLKDTKAFAVTSQKSLSLTEDQHMWKKKLWLLAKAVNVAFEARKAEINPSTKILACDPVLVDAKKMYEILDPSVDPAHHGEVDLENLLSKHDPPSIMTFTSLGLQELFHYLQMFFLKPRHTLFQDPFSKGEGAPTFLLFGPPETSLAKQLSFSFIASKDAMFETVGLVRGKPGGLGGGVTVKMGCRLMNFLPVRKARRLKLLLDKPSGTEFHPEVAEVASNVDGLIYYMDARCDCDNRHKELPIMKAARNQPVHQSPPISLFQNSWQSNISPKCRQHHLDNDLHELEAMLKVLPKGSVTPILVVLVGQGKASTSCGQTDSLEDDSDEEPREETSGTTWPIHLPADFYSRFCNLKNPWMIINADVPSLDGLRQGIHWIYERTKLLKGR